MSSIRSILDTVVCGDCLEAMEDIPDNSVDSIVTDPPYELGFMGKSWDNTGIANNVEMWKECLRVLKPGGYLLSFSGTRTYHRQAVAIEDAGFEVRDMIEWVYGSGFPKSLNIGKAVDKLQGNERKSLGITKGVGNNNTESMNSGVSKSSEFNQEYELTKGTSEWEGWGTALKPAHEPICMARKPLSEKTVALNCLKYGTGGINIDESRVGTEDTRQKTGGAVKGSGWGTKGGAIAGSELGRFPANLIHDNSEEVRECFPETKSKGHNPAMGKANPFGGDNNNPQEESYFTDSGNASRFFKSIIYTAKASKSERNKGCEELETSEKFTAGNYSQSPTCKDCNLTLNGTNDHSQCSGEVYYKEMGSKNTKNNHPTVKPIALMEYLIKMVTPKGGIVLDPFAGSGSTLVAAKQNGFNYIGIEMTEEYIPIIKARLNALDTKEK